MDTEQLIKKIEKVKEEFTFLPDKAKSGLLVKRVRALTLKKEITNNPVIKELVSALSSEVESITRFLAWDEGGMLNEDRKAKYIRRDAFIFFLSMFGDPEKELQNIEENIEENIKNLNINENE